MKTGDKVRIHYNDIDGIGYGDSVHADGEVVYGPCNGRVMVRYKDNYGFETQREFYPHDLTILE